MYRYRERNVKDETLAVISNERESNHRVTDICVYIYLREDYIIIIIEIIKNNKKIIKEG